MKNLLFSLALLSSLSVYGQWIELNSGTSEDLYDVYAVNENIALVVGSNGTILKTTDGGETWMPQNSGTTVDLRRIYFVNENIGFAVGFNGTLLKTIDTGANWEMIATETNEDLFGLSVISENLVFVSGANGVLKKTTNGGENWIDIDTPNNDYITDIQFFGEDVGFALIRTEYDNFYTGNLYKTVDDGSNWSNINPNISSFSLCFCYLDENTGFVSQESGVYRTNTGGVNYQEIFNTSQPMGSIFSNNGNSVWTASCDTPMTGDYCIYKGESISENDYTSIWNCDFPHFQSLYFTNESNGFAVGGFGTIYKNSTGNLMFSIDYNSHNQDLRMFPNPINTELNILLDSTDNATISIFDVSGKQIYLKSFNQKNIKINTSQFQKGVYILQVKTEQHHYTEKILIN